MEWTNERPTKPGGYWWRNNLGGEKTVMQVDESFQCWIPGDVTSRDMHYIGGQFAGPFFEPEEESLDPLKGTGYGNFTPLTDP